jgi:hypothetical protein
VLVKFLRVKRTIVDENKNNLLKHMNDNNYENIEIDNSEEQMFPRTGLPYELSEVLFIMSRVLKKIPLMQIADFVQRAPRTLIFKFFEYRPINPDGSLNFTDSVKTAEEAASYTKKVSMYTLDLPEDFEDAV